MSDKSLEKDWTKGSVIGNLLQLSWPMVSVEVLYAVVVVVELIWIGRLGPVSIAGVGLVDLFIIPIMSVDMGIIFGSRAMIARYAGAGDTKRVGIAVGQSILLGFFWGAFMTVVGVLLAERILSMFGSASEVVAQGAQYMRVFFAGLIGLEVLEMGQYAIQSSGDTTRPMIIELVTRFIHLTLCPFLVLGWWVFPMLGVGGAAMSQVIANGIGAVIVLWVLFSGRTRVRLTLSDLRPVPDIMWRILKVGIPSILMMLQRSIGSIVLMRIIVPFGTLAMSSHSLVLRLEAFIFAFCFGLGGGTGVMVGQNLGANQPKRAERSMWTGAG
ncbi:MAG: MATE family efflux transporter, partial [Dehalococcoidales bacterium]|nr:MATE family efflux transporter [Dehalococcoidales bacterium]